MSAAEVEYLYLQDYHTIYKLCYSDLQDHLQAAAVRHITEEGHALYERHARTNPHGLPGVALKVPALSRAWEWNSSITRSKTFHLSGGHD